MRHGAQMDRGRGYRRGTVMGLTVAEAFMLIAFVLLMLLGVWMATAREKITALENRVAAAEPFAQSFTEEQKAAALANRAQLSLLGNDLAKLEVFRTLAAQGATPSQAAMALELLPALTDGASPADLLDRLRLMDEAMLRDLAQAAVALDPDARAVLTDMAQLDDFPDLAELLRDGGLARLRDDLAKLAIFEEILDEGRDPETAADLAQALAAYRATGLTAEEVEALASQVDGLTRARLAAVARRAEIAGALQAQAGGLVAGLGGEILPDGSIVFRDTLLFDGGSARISPEFDAVLQDICRPWVETLYARRADLTAVRIEGHASSDWLALPPRAAFDRNLDLSQARAAAVFKRCLDHAGEDAIGQWARSLMTAVGYSSSRPIRTEAGGEDPVASRRVVFAIDTLGPEDTAAVRP
ncbi:OmpA family protein [Jannaschia sp. M317]|uniref:OmpA family protein n=1 Tax=Jannaschia sp. M317 TaxID=2867011 RepID=UPI0021A5C078|nr:OmpA family protein [Jannaschia sp. M317]UWQ17128.1 OmpA family protein [Jannaschia sp. M317]